MKTSKFLKATLLALAGLGLVVGIASCTDTKKDNTVVVQKTDEEKVAEALKSTDDAIDNEDALKSSFNVPSKAGEAQLPVVWTVKQGQVNGKDVATIGNTNDKVTVINIKQPYLETVDENTEPATIILTATITSNNVTKSKDFTFKIKYTNKIVDTVTIPEVFNTPLGTEVELNDVIVVDVTKGSTVLSDEDGNIVLLYGAGSDTFKVGQKGQVSKIKVATYNGAIQVASDKGSKPTFIVKNEGVSMPEAKLTTVKNLVLPNIVNSTSVGLNKHIVYTYGTLTTNQAKHKSNIITYNGTEFLLSSYGNLAPAELEGKLVKVTLFPITTSGNNIISAYGANFEEVTEIPAEEAAMMGKIDELASFEKIVVEESGAINLPTLNGYELTYSHLPSTSDEEKALINLDTKQATVGDKVKTVTLMVTATKDSKSITSYLSVQLGTVKSVTPTTEFYTESVVDGQQVIVQGIASFINMKKRMVFLTDPTSGLLVKVSGATIDEFTIGKSYKLTGTKGKDPQQNIVLNQVKDPIEIDSLGTYELVELTDPDTLDGNNLYKGYKIVGTVAKNDKYTVTVTLDNNKTVTLFYRGNADIENSIGKKVTISNLYAELYKGSKQLKYTDQTTVSEVTE